ncbi:MAG: enoyl-CoA hydratase-related protein [Chloroflexota bacterium]|nr:enoyl-CoA hydratase-related protein [Chloroflexota bacterium]
MPDYNRYQYIKVEKKDAVVIITLNRPEVLNAVNTDMHQELEDVLVDIGGDDEVRAVLLTGAGRAFCAGGDARSMTSGQFQPTGPRLPLSAARKLIVNLLEVEQPIVAAVNGDAVGLGATLALFCDIVIAAENARFGDTHVKVGLVAGDGGAIIWPLLVGMAKAKEYLLTGDLIAAPEAERIGLVNKVVPLEELQPTAMAMVQRLASGPTKAIRWTKFAVNKRLREEVNLILDTSVALEAASMSSADHQEAARAFLEKRPPKFIGQ